MFSWLFKKKAVDHILDPKDGHLAKVGAFIGSQQFTDQEKAEMMAGIATAVRDFSVATANQSTIRSEITRTIAIRWIHVQLAMILLSVLSLAHPNPELFKALWMIATSDVLMWGTFGVMTYFFGAYGWGAHIKKK